MALKLSSPASSTYYSTRRARARGRSGIPDWVWGAGLGGLVVIFVVAFFIVRSATGGSSDPCDSSLPPLTSETPAINAEAFAQEDAALKRVVDALTAGDRAGAEAQFFGPVHNFTHAVHPVIREKDPALAREFCRTIVDTENQLASGASSSAIALNMNTARGLLRDIAVVLGYPRP
jgi:hypothetical protein